MKIQIPKFLRNRPPKTKKVILTPAGVRMKHRLDYEKRIKTRRSYGK